MSLMRRLPKPVIGRLERVDEIERRGRVTLSWWNNATADPLKGVWASAITASHTAHLNVTIQNVPHQNEFLCHLP
jgi:raffinose/stachyose/melibiose transport system substrate-binding protein